MRSACWAELSMFSFLTAALWASVTSCMTSVTLACMAFVGVTDGEFFMGGTLYNIFTRGRLYPNLLYTCLSNHRLCTYSLGWNISLFRDRGESRLWFHSVLEPCSWGSLG